MFSPYRDRSTTLNVCTDSDAMQHAASASGSDSGNVNGPALFFRFAVANAPRQGFAGPRIYQPTSLANHARGRHFEYYQIGGCCAVTDSAITRPQHFIPILFKLLAESGDEILCPAPRIRF